MRRVISLWLPRFPTDRLAQEKARIARLGPSSGRTKRTGLPAPRAAEEPFATVAREAGGLRLAALNPAAEAAGLVPGMPLADAHALCPGLALAPAQPLEDARRLAELADWGVRYSPYVALDGADGLLLDVTGAALLFGGEEALLADLVRRVERLGFAALADGERVALAGLVITRQRPDTASGVIFMTLEDETGIANLVVWATTFERHRRIVLAAPLVGVLGKLKIEGRVIHVVAERLTDLTPRLRRLREPAPQARAPLDAPERRDFPARSFR